MRNKYYILSEQKGNPVPQIVNFHETINVQKLTREHYKELPPYFLLNMRLAIDLYYPDIWLNPIPLVSKEAMEVIRMYDVKMPFKFVALFDPEQGGSKPYYCPVLNKASRECGEVLFYMNIGMKRVLLIHEDLAESLLYRGATGMHLDELA